VWQRLYEELKDDGFVVITVAMDSRGTHAVRRPIRRAHPTHPSLIDTHHLVAELYNMVNVPQVVWIDEEGRIVRPTEVSGAALTLNLARMRRLKRLYLDAIRDWVRNGRASVYAFDEQEARAHLPPFTDDIAWAHANFHLGRTLWQAGKREEGGRFLKRAVELNPDSWNFFRQMKNLEHVLASGGPDFFRRTRRFRYEGRPYYALPDMPGMKDV